MAEDVGRRQLYFNLEFQKLLLFQYSNTQIWPILDRCRSPSPMVTLSATLPFYHLLCLSLRLNRHHCFLANALRRVSNAPILATEWSGPVRTVESPQDKPWCFMTPMTMSFLVGASSLRKCSATSLRQGQRQDVAVRN